MSFFEFLIAQWPLVTAFIVLLLLLLASEMRTRHSAATRISPQQATQLINKENAIVVDLRDDLAYKQGHIIDAWHILPAAILTNDKLMQQKDKPVVLVCQAGYQSTALGKQLRQQGFTQVYVIAGGIDNWLNSGLLLVKGK
jgi:rhodanese-related sulfurtransferase